MNPTTTASHSGEARFGQAFGGLGPSLPLTPPIDRDFFSSYEKNLPSLDSSVSNVGRYWAGGPGQPLNNTLPTPPTSESEIHKPQGPFPQYNSNLAAVATLPLAMGTSLDGVSAPQSLTDRRHANLPHFELPPPPTLPQFNNSYQKFPPLSALNVTHSSAGPTVGQLLTPPSNAPGDAVSPMGNTPTNSGIPPFTPSYWQPGTSPNSYSSWNNNNSMLPPRGMFSPSLNSMVRNTGLSTSTSESLPPPPYEIGSLPPFQTSMSMSGPPSTPHTHGYPNSSMGSSVPVPAPTQPAHPATMYQGHSSAPQSQSYGAYGPSSSVQQSPSSATASQPRASPSMSQSPGSLAGSNHFQRPPYPSYSMPGMPGPVMTNLHSPNGPMSMVGNSMHAPMYNSGYAAGAQQMFGPPGHNTAQPPNDRPFKCDQCTQSFNRNHDLKRHRRIHLAVKPFPCDHCDKSFSRKDALKRHILVKGCGDRGAKASARDSGAMRQSDSVSDDGSEE